MNYKVIASIDLDYVAELPTFQWRKHIQQQLQEIYKPAYNNDERIVVSLNRPKDNSVELLTEFQRQLNSADISNFFIVFRSSITIKTIVEKILSDISQDPVPWNFEFKEVYNYNSIIPHKIDLDTLNADENFLLTESKTFCMYPWIHLHAYPTGAAYPCCMADMNNPIGNCQDKSLKEIWNDKPMKDLRHKMLTNQPVQACTKCYEQEEAGFLSGRLSANKHHGHHIARVKETSADGTFDRFELVYWDIRFSNLCNLSCRSCGHIFSSSWYQDQAKLAGPEWQKNNRVLNYAGRTETDIWEQLIPHLDYVEQIYFAGGEPLMMEEHYNILDELERRGRFDVRLIYNTNFTQNRLKDRTVFDYWKRFKSVSVGASLDAMGPRAEYIRKGTRWDIVERNRKLMLEICPEVDFYISPTLSILNALHIPDFHKDWVNKGYLRPQDLNINILQDPMYYRIDIAPMQYKQTIKSKFLEHLEWLRPLDHLCRATVGFESAINFMMAQDNSSLIPKFWDKTNQLDQIRKENILEVIPEIKGLT